MIFHMSSNVFLQKFFTPITADTTRSSWYVDEFGAVPAFVASLVAIYFWRKGSAEFFSPYEAGTARSTGLLATPASTGQR